MFVRHHASFAGDVSEDDRHKRLGADIVDYHRAGLAAVTIDQCQHLHLVMERALFRRTLEVADKGFVHLDNAAARTERRKIAGAHRLTDKRSEERRVGTASYSKCRTRWSPAHAKKKKKQY